MYQAMRNKFKVFDYENERGDEDDMSESMPQTAIRDIP